MCVSVCGGVACIVHLCMYYLSRNCVAAIRCSHLWQDRRSSMCPLRKVSFPLLYCGFTEATPLMGLYFWRLSQLTAVTGNCGHYVASLMIKFIIAVVNFKAHCHSLPFESTLSRQYTP